MADGVIRLGAFAVIQDARGRLLLVHQQAPSRWSLPSGGVHFGESPIDALARFGRAELPLNAAAWVHEACTLLLASASRHPVQSPVSSS